jgi:hypothetical protein
MDGFPAKTPVGMPRGSLLRIDDGAGVLIHVWEGELWITQDGSPKDHVLIAGQSFRVESRGVTIAQAFKRSLVSLSAEMRQPAQALLRIGDEPVMAV